MSPNTQIKNMKSQYMFKLTVCWLLDRLNMPSYRRRRAYITASTACVPKSGNFVRAMHMLLVLLFPTAFAQTLQYFSESPVKLLTTKLFGSLYAASDSEFRISSDGVDEEVELSVLDKKNGMPDQELVLQPGEEAVFVLPLEQDLLFLMVKPGKKIGAQNSPFTDKANITLRARQLDQEAGVSKDCHSQPSDLSSLASDYCVLDLLPLQDLALPEVEVRIKVPENETRNAFIWQLHLSPFDDSERVMGTFTQEGRKQMRKTEDQEDTDTWLTMVSIVGDTGVGKSTVASLLSGNDTMFETQGSSVGSTTLGADISPLIPSAEYRLRMEEVLSMGPLHNTNNSRPLFLIDSEGMNFRGEEVDFVTTGPAAVVANIIVWITKDRINRPVTLTQIESYMNVLDRITMGNTTEGQQNYGEFIIVLNKMQGNESDEALLATLFDWDSSPEEVAILQRMTMKFKEIACIGLPSVDTCSDCPVTYPSLEDYPRFKEGLMKLANRILNESETPLDVTVGDTHYEMNSTNAEFLIGVLIDGANQGNTDLSDVCNVLFSISQESVIQELAKMTEELEMNTEGLCDNSTQTCTACACEYRNSAVDYTLSKLNDEIYRAMEEADALCNDPKIQEEISKLIEDMVIPWVGVNVCNTTSENIWNSGSVCDISEMRSLFEDSAGVDVQVDCDVLHICGNSNVHNSELVLTTNKIFIGTGSHVEQTAPEKALSGGVVQDEMDGEDGANGEVGKGIRLVVTDSLLTGSDHQFQITLRGGEGGDGGAGGSGKPGVQGSQGNAGESGMPGANGEKGEDGYIYGCDHPAAEGDATDCNGVIEGPGTVPGSTTRYGKEKHCCHLGECDTYKYWQLYTYYHTSKSPCDPSLIDGKDGGDGERGFDGGMGGNGTDATPGTKGGNGGRGGSGGEAGEWQLEASPEVPLNAFVTRIGGAGGAGGAAGPGGSRASGGAGGEGGAGGAGGQGGDGGDPGQCNAQERVWTAHKNWHQRSHCNHFCTGCDRDTVNDPCSDFAPGSFGECLIDRVGAPGRQGGQGADGADGAAGYPGMDAETAEAGEEGEPGEDATTYLL